MALVMFDLDGTLLDTASEIGESVNRTLTEFKLPMVELRQVREWIGHGTGWLMRRAWSEVAGSDDSMDWAVVMRSFNYHYENCAGSLSRPYPDVLDTLAALAGRGVKRAVVTNKEGRFTEKILRTHGLEQSFDMVVSGDTYPVKKPDPLVIYNCLQGCNQAAADALFVGDSSIDVETARAAGVACWAVPYGYNMGQPIEAAGPDRVIETIKDVLVFFEGER